LDKNKVMNMNRKIWIIALLLCGYMGSALGTEQDSVQYIQKVEIGKKKRKTFQVNNRDSVLVLTIDTLIMKDKASLSFYGNKKVTLKVNYAEIPDQAYIIGTDSKNNGSNMDIQMHLEKLGKLYVMAGGLDANNGTRTYPNGNGGKVTFRYDRNGVLPQQEDKDKPGYLHIHTKAGGYRVNPQSDLYNVYSQIRMGVRAGNGRLGGVPQGQIYSGSPGKDGKSEVVAY